RRDQDRLRPRPVDLVPQDPAARTCTRRYTLWRNAMKWVTRARPKTDRIACPWLIRRFIDPDAEIVYVPADQVLDVAAREGGHSFDAKDATYTHRGNLCTFEVLIEEYHLGSDPALVR